MNYATLYQLRADLGPKSTADDALLLRHLTQGTRVIDWLSGGRRHYDPRRKTRHFDAYLPWRYSSEILLDDDLLAVLTLTNGDATTIASTEYLLAPANRAPYFSVKLKSSSTVTWQADSGGEPEQAIGLEGIWGYHTRYEDAWADTLDSVVDNPLAINATTLTLADVDGVASDSDEPRLQAGNLIRFGAGDDKEMALVISTDTTLNTAVIARGQNGSTAASQAAGTKLYVFRPWDNAHRALMRLATYTYRLKDVSFFEKITIIGSTQKVAPAGIPDDVLELLPVRPAIA